MNVPKYTYLSPARKEDRSLLSHGRLPMAGRREVIPRGALGTFIYNRLLGMRKPEGRVWSFRDLAQACGVSPKTVRTWIKGEAVPSEARLARLATILQADKDTLSDLARQQQARIAKIKLINLP